MRPLPRECRLAVMIGRAGAILTAVLMVVACADVRANDAPRRSSADYSSLYDDSTLTYWQGRYAPNVRVNLDTLLAHLTASEQAAVRGLTLEMPLRDNGDPLAYYAAPGRRVVMSTLSIKFFDDLAQATAWLVRNEYSNESVAYYVSVLKCRGPEQFPGGQYSPPLRALGIPPDVLADSFVNDVSLKVLNGAVVFTLAHELGHVVLHHTATESSNVQQLHEAQADSFAVDMFRRLGVPPMGVETFFFVATYLMRNRGDFSSDNAYAEYIAHASHPVTAARMKALANALRRRPEDFARHQPNPRRGVELLASITARVDSLGSMYDDPDLQQHTAIVCQQIPLSELRPRRVGHSWFPRQGL